MLYPSILAHIASGLLAFGSLVYVFLNWSKLVALDPYRTLILLLGFSAVLGIHGISHAQLEREYRYFPLYWRENL
jgi:hypothetical protein